MAADVDMSITDEDVIVTISPSSTSGNFNALLIISQANSPLPNNYNCLKMAHFLFVSAWCLNTEAGAFFFLKVPVLCLHFVISKVAECHCIGLTIQADSMIDRLQHVMPLQEYKQT